MEGSDQQALTTGRSDYKPLVSPDNRWLYFMSFATGRSRVMKMRTDGTAVSALCEAPFLPLGIKPDDTQLIGVLLDDKGGLASKGLRLRSCQ